MVTEVGWAQDIVEAALAQGKETVEFPGFRGAPYTLVSLDVDC